MPRIRRVVCARRLAVGGGAECGYGGARRRICRNAGAQGLLGPQGTGVLLCRDRARPIMAGGTGSESRNQAMPETLPDALEAGTHNIPGIAGLLAGLRYVKRRGLESIDAHERKLKGLMCRKLAGISGLEVFSSPTAQSGVLSVRSGKLGSEEIAAALGARGVAVRAGTRYLRVHCAIFVLAFQQRRRD